MTKINSTLNYLVVLQFLVCSSNNSVKNPKTYEGLGCTCEYLCLQLITNSCVELIYLQEKEVDAHCARNLHT